MKKTYAFTLMSGALLLGACSSETPEGINNEPEGGLGYIRIDFEDMATRATDANASKEEVEISTADFIFYDANGNYLHTSHITDTKGANGRWLSDEEGSTHGGNKCAVVKLPMMAASVGCVINSTSTISDPNPEYMSNYAQDMVNNKLFYMSSSHYYDAAGKRVFVSPIDPATQLFREEKEAAAATGDNAVKVYVERYVARVDVKYDLGNTINAGVINPQSGDTFINGTITFVPEYTYLTSECLKSTRIKRLPATVWDWMKTWNYNDLNKHCSYIVDYTTVADGSNMKYTTLNKMKAAGANFNIDPDNKLSMYVNENCEKDTVRMTSLVIAGKYEVKNTNGTVVAADGTGTDPKGTFYLVAFNDKFDAYATEAETILAMGGNPATDMLVPEGVGANNIIKLPGYGDQVKWEGWNGWMKLVDKATGKDKEIVTRCVKYSGGYGYYAKKIKRATIGTTNYHAIVRNHVYELTVKGIAGMGVGIPDPDQPIIPIDGPDPNGEHYYIHMNVNINPWTLVSNEVIWK